MIKKISHRLVLSSLMLFGMIFVCAVFAGQPKARSSQEASVNQIAKLQLQMEVQRLQETQREISQLAQEQKGVMNHAVAKGVTQADLDLVTFAIANAKASIGNIKIALADAMEAVLLTQNELAELKKQGQTANVAVQTNQLDTIGLLTKKMVTLQNLLDIQNQRISYLTQNKSLAVLRLHKLKEWLSQLQKLRETQLQQYQHQSIALLEEKLQNEQQKLLEKLSRLDKQFNDIAPQPGKVSQKKEILQFQIFTTQEQVSIKRLALFLTQLQERVTPLVITTPESRSVAVLYDDDQQAAKILVELTSMASIVKDKIKLIQFHNKLLKNNQHYLMDASQFTENSQLLNQLIADYQSQLNTIAAFQLRVSNYRQQIQGILKHQFTIRQMLPGLDGKAWSNLGYQILQIPKLLGRTLQNTGVQLLYQFKMFSSWRVYLFVLIVTFLLTCWLFLRKSMVQMLRALEDSSRRFSSQVLTVLLTLVRKNLGLLFVMAGLLGLRILFEIDLSLWMSMTIIFLVYRTINILTRLWLLESAVDIDGKDVRLYHGLKWIFRCSGILTVLTLLAHSLPVAYDVKILFNKIFMLLLLGVSLLLFRAWSVLPALLERVFAVRRNYVLRVIRLICWVLPVTLATNAIIGLIGYVDLAGAIGKYQAYSLFILVLYMIARGLLMDFMELNYELLIRHFKAGWLWAQAFIRPLDRILRVTLFLTTLGFLLHCYGLDQNPTFMHNLRNILRMPLMNIAGNEISIKWLIGIMIFVAMLYWVAKWSREFAFRWFFARAKDIGLRNSLSVFTQYLVVIIGVVVGLRVFGVDLKGFAVIAAAFAAGLGFALRDLAGNLISGVVLLIERPFRVGDSVTIDSYEGEIISSGVRALKIRTWDHMDVIVPNSEVFTKPFINWTHHDSIVRSVVKIKVDRADDPLKVQQLILNVLKEHKSVVKDPEPEVFMKEISDSLIEFEVRYHINLSIDGCRPRVRSSVLFAVWECFKKHGIRAPKPQYDIFFQTSRNNELNFINEQEPEFRLPG